MARTKKQTPTEPPEKPVGPPKPRKVVKSAVTIDDLMANQVLIPAAELEPPPREIIEPTPDTTRPRESHRFNGTDHELPTLAEKVQRPALMPVPDGFFNVSRHAEAGIRVNKSLDKRVVAIQFAEDRLPTRAEKDILEALGQPEERKFSYKPASRQWEREASGSFGANIVDATRMADELAKERTGRGR